ncbi:MAG: hypothetical protein AUJ57_06455 [Zetaproteobacteria bacterium CG1_02_53_45]|nr:MAG: hypothetical protein AUJ57_06455 [Zetaproteobacteria bacterium CG1_02_53_45]
MEQQRNQLKTFRQVQRQLGLYQLMLQSNAVEAVSKSPAELLAVYETLLTMQEAIATHINTVESQLSGPEKVTALLPSKQSNTVEKLSGREMEVLQMFAKGYSYGETAQALNCQLTTIQTHIKRIYKKLNVHSRSEAVFEASQLGLLQI